MEYYQLKDRNLHTYNNMNELGEYYTSEIVEHERQMYNVTYMEIKYCNKLNICFKKETFHR